MVAGVPPMRLPFLASLLVLGISGHASAQADAVVTCRAIIGVAD